MSINPPRPLNDVAVCTACASIGASPVVAAALAPCSGYIERVGASPGGTTTGTITVAVAVTMSSWASFVRS